jgi:type IV pilus assembly protein PilN
VILINLLPHREAARRSRREAFFFMLGASVILGVLLSGAVYLWQVGQVARQEARNELLRSEIALLEKQIKDISTLQADIAALRARQQAVENLQADRNIPVNLLNELARLLPEGVYLTSLKQDNQSVLLTGVAHTNERVSELLRQLGHGSEWLSRPELVEIVAGTVNLGPREQRRVANFTLRVRVSRAGEARPAAGAASAAPSGSPGSPAAPASAGGAAAPSTAAASARS